MQKVSSPLDLSMSDTGDSRPNNRVGPDTGLEMGLLTGCAYVMKDGSVERGGDQEQSLRRYRTWQLL